MMKYGPPLPLDQYNDLCEKAKKVEWMEELIKKITPESVHDFMDVYVVVPVEVWEIVIQALEFCSRTAFSKRANNHAKHALAEIGGDVTQSSNGSSPEGRREDD
ncbi:MAG: hypothetical protein ACYSW8_32140 [Planctomycetota bacterium]|jgi:hypothetical protein